ncbi:MAG: hypothetical protein E7H60_19370 [Pseudomonas oryzihabitans]|uniref:hypothetical protein n=1 Tax=Pseudomonas oryzihabitans TaxID=47885 RepID=UPI002912EF1F|nr:hypothetical protein [Pseudomonas oryzihabitans]MDU4058704.1 hypothetical protein [Pseudomonas oryzihabitans]
MTCHGRGVTRGVFYEMECDACAGTGWVDHATGQAMPAEDLVFTLSHRLLHLEQQLATLQRMQPYESSNRRGPHGSHRTGD